MAVRAAMDVRLVRRPSVGQTVIAGPLHRMFVVDHCLSKHSLTVGAI
jgi:hypothetical protein